MDGISANPEKVETVQNKPILSSLKELHSCLGLVSYYRHFIPNFAAIPKCLHELMGPTHIIRDKKAKAGGTELREFQWTDKHLRAFHLLKAHLTSMPVLGYPGFSFPFELETDASL